MINCGRRHRIRYVCQKDRPAMTANNAFVHHVFFYLHDPASLEDQTKLIAGLNTLAMISYFKLTHIGVPADTHRDVVERGYNVSWMVFFENQSDQDIYQSDPIHLAFIEENKHLWKKVVVYDSVNADWNMPSGPTK